MIIPEYQLPGDMQIKKLQPEDIREFIALIDLFEDVFGMKNFTRPADAYLQKVLSKPGFFVFSAKEEDKVIGGLTVYILEQYYSEKPLAYIYDLAVATKHQRKGIGKKLIEQLVACCRENNVEEIFVQADKADDYALDFYRSTGISGEEQVVHFSYATSQTH